MPSGYLSKAYANSLSGFGNPMLLPRCGGWVLVRGISGSQHYDAMGLYPIFCCLDWRKVKRDLEDLKNDLVSLTLVTDPFGDFSQRDLEDTFDVVRFFKNHFVTEPARDYAPIICKHHRYYTKKSLESCTVEIVHQPLSLLDIWVRLYDTLIMRHDIAGIQAFSKESFARQLQVPGLVAFKASVDDQTVGIHLWYAQKDIAYSHLAATSQRGYDVMASYALYAGAIEYFYSNDTVKWLDFGAGAGPIDKKSGLTWFKKGWSKLSRPAFLCCKILQPNVYDELSSQTSRASYLPAYRGNKICPR